MAVDTPAFVVTSSFIPSGEVSLDAYGKSVGPLLGKYDAKLLVGGLKQKRKVLEDTWGSNAGLGVIRFPTMTALNDFWFSSEYQKAIPLRTDVIKTNFTIGIEGKPNEMKPGVSQGPPAFILSVSEMPQGSAEKLGPYSQAVQPLLKQHGGVFLAGGPGQPVKVLEDSSKWEKDWRLALIKFESMEKLKGFWFSEEYQKALPLRTKVVKSCFTVAVEGLPQ